MGALAVFGIENDGLNLAVNLLLLFLVVVWLALIYWTFADARRRIADPLLVGCATAASLFPFVGTIVYLIVRPPEYLEDVRERNLEIAAAQARLESIEHLHCQYCGFEVEKAFLRCPRRRRPAGRARDAPPPLRPPLPHGRRRRARRRVPRAPTHPSAPPAPSASARRRRAERPGPATPPTASQRPCGRFGVPATGLSGVSSARSG